MITASALNFSEWRNAARQFLMADTPPDVIQWQNEMAQKNLFDTFVPKFSGNTEVPMVPKYFLHLAKRIACHSESDKWPLLYHALWRITHGEPHVLELVTDQSIHRLHIMNGEIGRDMHKTKAFVRFRLLKEDGQDHYIAWHRPDHRILTMVAPFFQRRFAVMRWSIFTPHESVFWDGEHMHHGAGVPMEDVAHEDQFEDLWRVYYRSTFNPARIKIKMMKREMPVRHWATLPETRLIPGMLAEAEARVGKMIDAREGNAKTAADYFPDTMDFPTVKTAAAQCKACSLHCHATQTVFGIGPMNAPIMLVGEQPGDQEDQSGVPFIGPAGQVLDTLLNEIRLPRDRLYITNAVKHFKFTERDGRRVHLTPDIREVIACKPWLSSEIEMVKPKIIVTLGVTAARALIHYGFTLKKSQGQSYAFNNTPLHVTWHPSAVLRTQDAASKAQIMQHMRHTLREAAASVPLAN